MKLQTTLIVLLVSACAHVQAPASQPASMPGRFIVVDAGEVIYEQGIYAPVAVARSYLKAKSDYELGLQEDNAQMKAQRDADAKQLAKEDWLARWGLPTGGAVGLVVGVILGVVVSHK